MNVATSKRRRPKRTSFHPVFEQLEPRHLLSAAPLVALADDAASLPVAMPLAEIVATPTGGYGAIAGFHPSQIAEAYGFDAYWSSRGRGQTIAIVSAFHNPDIVHDLEIFNRTFRLPESKFDVVFARGVEPAVDPGWGLETALDVELAHAVAPGAKIVLVEASSNNFVDLFQAVHVATQIPGVSVVSMSWGAAEFSLQTSFDPIFTTNPHITFVAAAGDAGAPPVFPAVSPYVVAVGGTALKLNRDDSYRSEVPWTFGGGGPSAFYAEPSYQTSANLPGSVRSTPDISFNADPATPYAVYSTQVGGGWTTVGGTSSSTPVAAGMFAIANQMRTYRRMPTLRTVHADLYSIYGSSRTYASAFHDIRTGFIVNIAGSPPVYNAVRGYDMASGIGTPRADRLIDLLGKFKETIVMPLSTAAIPLGYSTADASIGVSALPLAAGGRITVSSSAFDFAPSTILVGAGFKRLDASLQPTRLPSLRAQEAPQLAAEPFDLADRSPAADPLNLSAKFKKRHDWKAIDEELDKDELEACLWELVESFI